MGISLPDRHFARRILLMPTTTVLFALGYFALGLGSSSSLAPFTKLHLFRALLVCS